MKRWYEMSPSTSRSARKLSRACGFENPQAFAASLPLDAFVVDVGSGKSKFGNSIATIRPDVQWVNVDLRNGHMRAARRLQTKAPSNVRYVAGDALNLPIRPGSVQRVFSTALLPHIEMDSPELANQAFRNMAGLLADEGEIAINGFGARRNSAMHISADQFYADPDGVSQAAVDRMALSPFVRFVQKTSNILGHLTLLNY